MGRPWAVPPERSIRQAVEIAATARGGEALAMNHGAKLDDLTFPVVLYRDGYLYIAQDATDLCLNPRRLFPETAQQTWTIADSSGAVFRVPLWQEIKPQWSWKVLVGCLLGSVFAAPVLERERTVTAATLAQELGDMIARHRLYEGWYDTEPQFREDLAQVQTFQELFNRLRRLP